MFFTNLQTILSAMEQSLMYLSSLLQLHHLLGGRQQRQMNMRDQPRQPLPLPHGEARGVLHVPVIIIIIIKSIFTVI